MKTIALVAFVLICSFPARAQDDKVELFGGYSYLGVVSGGFTSVPLGLQSDVAVNINKWFGVEGDINYSSYFGAGIFTAAGGPRFTVHGKRTDLFFHGLVGVTNASASAPGYSVGVDALTFGGGAGLDVKVHKYIAIRAFQADFISADFSGVLVNAFRLSSGIVFTFGGRGERSNAQTTPRTSQPVEQPQQQIPQIAVSEAALLGVSGYGTDAGFKITSVRSSSPADQISLKPGDVVLRIDGRAVHDSREIELAIAASPSGTIKVNALVQTTATGLVSSEKEVKVR